MAEQFEDILRKDLHQFLLSMKEVDDRLPECPDAPAHRASHQGSFRCLRRLPTPALPRRSRHATQTNGLSHDKDELTMQNNSATRQHQFFVTGMLDPCQAMMPPFRFTHL